MEREDLEHEADVLDRASRTTAEHIDDCVQHYRRLAAPEQERLPDGSWSVTECISCGDQIPEQRLQHGKIRCVSCQEHLEKRGKLYVG